MQEQPETTRKFRDYSIEPGVNPIWKTATFILATALLAGAGPYLALILQKPPALTQVDVDREITIQQAAIVQRLTDLSGQVTSLTIEVDKLRDEESQRSKH